MSQSLVEKALCLFAKVFWFSLALCFVGYIWLGALVCYTFVAPNLYWCMHGFMTRAQVNDDSLKALALAEKYEKKYGAHSNASRDTKEEATFYDALSLEIAHEPEKALAFFDSAKSDSKLSFGMSLFRARLEYKTGNLQGAFTDYCAAPETNYAQQFTKIVDASELSQHDVSDLRDIIREIVPVVNEGVVTTAFVDYGAFLNFLREQRELSESPDSYDDAIAFWEKLGELSAPFVKAPKWDFRNWSGGHDWYYWEKEFQLNIANAYSHQEYDDVSCEPSNSEQTIMIAEE